MTATAGPLAAASERWRRRCLALALLRTVAAVVPVASTALTAWLLDEAVLAGLLVGGAVGTAVWAWRRWRPPAVDPAMMARHLDRRRAELEESSELLLRQPDELPLLGRLQRRRVQARVAAVESELKPPAVARAVTVLVAATIGSVVVSGLALRAVAGQAGQSAPVGQPAAATDPAAAPQVVAVVVRITPPTYTGRSARTAEGLDLSVEEGAQVEWRVEVAGDLVGASLVFDESEAVAMAQRSQGVFELSRTAVETELYRLELEASDGSMIRGEYARLDVLVDQPPEVAIVEPARFVELAGGRGQRIDIVVEARDDHGLGKAALVATVASGYGELVEFRERRLAFDREQEIEGGGRRYSSRLDLDALGVSPGSELFFFAEGKDRRQPQPQSGRSATHIVRLPGDRTASVGLSSRLPILRVPEFFRSQRQIIIDTERLLGEESAITEAEFRRRSESLGFDQRALRLRYGGLLGEEFDAGRGGEEEAEEHDEDRRRLDEMEPGGGGSREDVREALETLTQGLAHQHDSADAATYFDSEIKAQLKAALEEMWGAEGKLRVIEPRRALPFEYRALTLLKQVQQRSRLYVQKIGFEAPVLYPEEKRLTGDLTKIRTRRREGTARPADELAGVRAALAALGGEATVEPSQLLSIGRDAARQLADRARLDPTLELTGLEALRRWITALEEEQPVEAEVAAGAIAALWSLLPEPGASPALPANAPTGLEADYRRRLSAPGSP